MKFGLSEDEQLKIKSVFMKYPQIQSVTIYGSRSMGNYKTGSDIDLTIKGDGLNLQLLCKINNDLDDLFLPYKFDISFFQDINNLELIDHIHRRGQIFYDSKSIG
ncbi:MAG TPA: nucleotidyltransferase domain-containing protein [Chlamydiales bacterium]|nr:nucleotidyltransferase domain-containing protein [Chlamydiales bacterium]